MKPLNDSVASQLFNEDFDPTEITPTTREVIEQNIRDGLPTHFGDQYEAKVAAQAAERGVGYKLSDAEREEIEREVAENGWGSLCRCSQADFKDPDPGVRYRKATMVNLYFEYGGDWEKVFRDSRSCSRRSMSVYWRDELFRTYIAALDPILMLEARGVVVHVWKEGVDEKARLAAALRFLEYSDAKNWDRGVRKQIVANKGSLDSVLFNKVLSDEDFLNTYIKDKLNKLPDNVREALELSVKTTPQAEPAPGFIHAADMSKLKDPFGEEDERATADSDEEV